MRRLLQARDATIADLMAMVEGLITRQHSLMEDFDGENVEARAEAEAQAEADEAAREEAETEQLRNELEEKIATLEEKKNRLEALLQASKDALDQQLE